MNVILLKLYTTSHCHLCESAHELALEQLSADQLTLVEIADDGNLLAQYGMRIPVLQRLDSFAELGWPFDADTLRTFLKG